MKPVVQRMTCFELWKYFLKVGDTFSLGTLFYTFFYSYHEWADIEQSFAEVLFSAEVVIGVSYGSLLICKKWLLTVKTVVNGLTEVELLKHSGKINLKRSFDDNSKG